MPLEQCLCPSNVKLFLFSSALQKNITEEVCLHVFYTNDFFRCNVRAESTLTQPQLFRRRKLISRLFNLFPFCCCCTLFSSNTDARSHYDISQCKFCFIERQCVSTCKQIVVVFKRSEKETIRKTNASTLFSLISSHFTTEPATPQCFVVFVFILCVLCLHCVNYIFQNQLQMRFLSNSMKTQNV